MNVKANISPASSSSSGDHRASRSGQAKLESFACPGAKNDVHDDDYHLGWLVTVDIFQNRAERAMQRGEYLAAIHECQMGKARILKRNKNSLHSAFYSGYPRTLT